MLINKLPHNCSAYYMHQVSEFDKVKEATADLIKRDVASGPALKRISAIFTTVLKIHKALLESFLAAGFRIVAQYKSHNHGNRTVVMLFRPVTRKEFDSGIALWPHRKNARRKRG